MKNCSYLPNALAYIKGSNMAPTLSGEVKFYQKNDHVLITANICGLPQTDTGFFGFHIHEGNRCSGKDFADTKGHYNPTNDTHPRHSGDLPALLRCGNGAYLSVATDRFNVMDIIGKTVVIHDNPDDFTTQPSGNSGTKIACGVIQKR